jgi:hypothetical protein
MSVSIAYFVAFQCGWFACVLGAAHERAWLGAALVALLALVHLLRSAHAAPELALLAITGAIGTLWDTMLIQVGLIKYSSGFVLHGLAPYWIIALWILFATTLNVMLRWLRGRALIAAALGALGGPLSFWSGARLGALSLPHFWPAMAALAAGWAVITPLLVRLSQRFDGQRSALPRLQEAASV